ncbi:hypothetical protein SKAU_G00409010 [Synaphobranchus kaupii]|uniref:Septin-type G domain-containing protein n=1 Tax=Synaphobranchus kaupii TaxID=118154 RepID=A0A9Q1EAK0_SYNKA|nr:hypothetical protein SKAU_G00409010 [Synaphobranchus kaupii]
MAECYTSSSMTREESTSKWSDVIKNSKLIATEPMKIYVLNTVKKELSEDGLVRKYTFGKKDNKQRNRTIMLVGQTGTGKSALINMMLNYMLVVKWEDNVRFQIIPDEGERLQTQSQTSAITAYEIFGLEDLSLPFSLTVIDTPGYGDTKGPETDKSIAQNLYTLFNSSNGVQQIDAACLVVKASENRLSAKEIYIFESILSIFGKNMEKNLMALITFSDWTPPSNALLAVTASGVPFPKDENDEHVHFLFNNLPLQKPAKKYEKAYKTGWDNGTESLSEFFQALDQMETESLKMTENVLKERRRLEVSIHSLESQIQVADMRHKEVEDHRKTLEMHREDMMKNNNFQYKYNAVVLELVVANESATICPKCEVNCHYPGCSWVTNLSWCSAMKRNFCTICPEKCSYKVHKKGDQVYMPKLKEITLTFEDKKKKAEGIILTAEQVMAEIQQQVKDAEDEKNKLVEKSYLSIVKLKELALKFITEPVRQSILKLINCPKKDNKKDMVENLEKMLKETRKET